MANYEIWVSSPTGERIDLITKLESMVLSKTLNKIGVVELVLPGGIYDKYLGEDNIIEVSRSRTRRPLKNIDVFFIREWAFLRDNSKQEKTLIVAENGNTLLDRRIVAYAAESTQAKKTGYADNIMCEVLRENFGSSATDSARNIAATMGFEIQADISKGASITKQFAYRNILVLLQDLANASRQNSKPLYFEVQPRFGSKKISFEFIVRPDYLGADRTGNNKTLIGSRFGNLEGAAVRFSYANEKTVIYAGGQGETTNRNIQTRIDTARVAASPYNRNEAFYNVSGQAETTAAVQSEGDTMLATLRPVQTITNGIILDGPGAYFGIDWDFGDKVEITERGGEYTVLVNNLTISLDKNGKETIQGRFEVV